MCTLLYLFYCQGRAAEISKKKAQDTAQEIIVNKKLLDKNPINRENYLINFTE
jgi:hypothetical protein